MKTKEKTDGKYRFINIFLSIFFVNRRYSFNATNIFFPPVRWSGFVVVFKAIVPSRYFQARSLSPSLLTVPDAPDNDADNAKLHISYLFNFSRDLASLHIFTIIPPRFYRGIEQWTGTGTRTQFTSTAANTCDSVFDGGKILWNIVAN